MTSDGLRWPQMASDVPGFVVPPEGLAPPFPGFPSAPPPAQGPSPLFSSPNRRIVKKIFEEVPPPGLSEGPAPSLAPEGQPWITELLGSMREIKTYITTQMVTREQFERYHSEQSATIASTVAPIHEEMQVLRARVEVLESARHRSVSEQPRATDPAFKRIVFKQLPEALNAHERIQAIESFMRKHFEHVRVKDIANFYKGRFPDNRSLTRAAYVEFSNSDVRREVLSKIGGQKGAPIRIKCEIGGKEVTIRSAMTEAAVQRNACLRRVADQLRADPRCAGQTVKPEFMGERGVTVDKVYAFTQGKNDVTGKYIGKFANLTVP